MNIAHNPVVVVEVTQLLCLNFTELGDLICEPCCALTFV